MLFGGLGSLLWSMQQGISNEELLARLDEGEQGFFQPAGGSQPLAPPVTPVPARQDSIAHQIFLPGISSAAVVAIAPAPTQVLPTPAPTPTPEPSPTPLPTLPPAIPDRLLIPAIGLDAPVTPVEPLVMTVEGSEYRQWAAPDQFAAGWHDTSARLFEAGNLVLNGHNNIYGSVFMRLQELQEGDLIYLSAGDQSQVYLVSNIMLLEERGQPLEVRMQNAGWIQPSEDRRLTLITCWPIESNTHRLIVVAVPYP